jgi:hypothetical protein
MNGYLSRKPHSHDEMEELHQGRRQMPHLRAVSFCGAKVGSNVARS